MDQRLLTLSQLDRTAARLKAAGTLSAPTKGWIRTLREALGITTAQLARQLGLRQQSIVGFEKREPAGEITLKQLRKIADALDCDVICAMVPRKSLRERVERRAADLAKLEIASVAHSMALEAQGTDPRLKADRIEQRKRVILDQRWSRLWD